MKSLYSIKSAMFLVLILISSIAYANSQNLTNKGKDFWFAFPPNSHQQENAFSAGLRFGDSLHIYVSATVPTKGTIEYKDYFGRTTSIDFEITGANGGFYHYSVFHHFHEIYGQIFRVRNNFGQARTQNQCQTPVEQTFHVTTNEEVAVYILNYSFFSTDATLIYPTDRIGNDYIVMSYPSDYQGGFSPSQFVVVATEDDTFVEIKPTAMPSESMTQNPINVILQKGQAYLVQTKEQTGGDFTGTRITSNKNVTVLSGHHRANVTRESPMVSRDHLITQLVPLDYWGYSAYIVPLPISNESFSARQHPDRVRVICAEPNTDVYINGVLNSTINPGDIIDIPASEAMYINASEIIQIAYFRKSAITNTNEFFNGDPFMLSIPSEEQFAKQFNLPPVECVTFNEDTRRFEDTFPERYLTVISKIDNVEKITLNGVPLNRNTFAQIAGSEYYFSHITVQRENYIVESEEPIIVYSYGYGDANSYGFVGGISFEPFDRFAPEITAELRCFDVNGQITELNENDTKIRDITILRTDNVQVQIDAFDPEDEIVGYNASLEDKFLDGSFEILARDFTSRNPARKFEEIKGFTVAIIDFENELNMTNITEQADVMAGFCFNIQLENYGKFEQDFEITLDFISDFVPEDKRIYLRQHTLQPGEIKDVEICLEFDGKGLFEFNVVLSNSCIDRDIVFASLTIGDDEEPPQISLNGDCFTDLTILVEEPNSIDAGIDFIEVRYEDNCIIRTTQETNKSYTLSVNVIDPYQDAEFEVYSVDLRGNESVFREVIPGFTIAFGDPVTHQELLDMGTVKIKDYECIELPITNYGKFPFVIDDLFLAKNVNFSIPRSLLPMSIEPGETRNVDICFQGFSADETYTDFIELEFRCITRRMDMTIETQILEIELVDKCDIRAIIRLSEAENLTTSISAVYPVPATNKLDVNFSVAENCSVVMQIANSQGVVLYSAETSKVLPGNIYEADFDVSKFANGVYFLRMIASDAIITKPIIISK